MNSIRKKIVFILVMINFSITVLAEPVVVIVNKDNPIEDITVKDLDKIFTKKKTSWLSGGKIVAINRDYSDEGRENFSKVIHKKSNLSMKKFWLNKQVKGIRPPITQPSGASVKALVSRVPEAIGYIFLSKVDDTIKVLKVEGLTFEDEGYLLLNE